MKRVWVGLACLLSIVGCSGPHSTGALWAQQDIDQEGALFRLTDAQRADERLAFELGLVDADLAAEQARIEAGMQDCPGSSRLALGVSSGDRVRDGIRVRAQGDQARLASVARLALADWRLRRARSSGGVQLCADARQALAGSDVQPGGADLVSSLGSAVVSRDPQHVAHAASSVLAGASNASLGVTLSSYALGYLDTVEALSPLPQYLAAVYGGTLVQRAAAPDLGGRTAEALVDELAPAYPAWEPDAIYAALLGQ